MKGTIHAHSENQIYDQERTISFNKEFFVKSKFVLLAMGVALLYCMAYGVVLYHEFKKMGVLDLVKDLI